MPKAQRITGRESAHKGFYSDCFQRALFDIEVFTPNSSNYQDLLLSTAHMLGVSRKEKKEKSSGRVYENGISEIELESFTHLESLIIGSMCTIG